VLLDDELAGWKVSNERDIEDIGYAEGVEVCPKVDGWVVITGKEGEDFHPVAFFFDKARAEQYCDLTYDDGDGNIEPVAFDACALEAVVIRDRIVCSNDFTIDSPEKLREHVERALTSPPPRNEGDA